MKIKFLQGYNGDCILITVEDAGVIRNILIDGGTGNTYSKRRKAGNLKKEILSLRDKNQAIDLLVITHIDDDHIGGVLKMFEDKKFDKSLIKKVWFNSGKLIAEYFGEEGEFEERDINLDIFKGLNTSVKQGVKLDSFLSSIGCWDYRIIKNGLVEKLGGCKIIVLSPDVEGLKKLHNKWERESPESLETSSGKTDYHISVEDLIKKQDIFEEDKSIPNGSSIAFLLEKDDKKILLLGDSHPSIITESLKELGYSSDKKLELDLFKISHHASRKNTNNELLEIIDCDTYVTLTNSLKHGLPDKLTYARIIKNNPSSTLMFNYDIVNKVFSQEDLDLGEFEAIYLNKETIILD